jgi:hypothetical protein
MHGAPRSRATKNPARIVPLLYSRVTIQLDYSVCPPCVVVAAAVVVSVAVVVRRRSSVVAVVVVAVVVVVVRRRPGFRLRKRFQI